jgi:hypothetical protein
VVKQGFYSFTYTALCKSHTLSIPSSSLNAAAVDTTYSLECLETTARAKGLTLKVVHIFLAIIARNSSYQLVIIELCFQYRILYSAVYHPHWSCKAAG